LTNIAAKVRTGIYRKKWSLFRFKFRY
jgi:hypothetical protein